MIKNVKLSPVLDPSAEINRETTRTVKLLSGPAIAQKNVQIKETNIPILRAGFRPNRLAIGL